METTLFTNLLNDPSINPSEVPIVRVRIYRNPQDPIDVRCVVFNESHFQTQALILLNAQFGDQKN